MERFRLINFLLVVSTLLLVNCSKPKQVSKTDYDQLFAVWYDNDHKDSLAQLLKPAVDVALKLENSTANRVVIDSVLDQLRWTRDSVSFFKLSNKAIKYAKAKSDHQMLANAYNDIGMYYHDLGVLDSTFYYYIKAENSYRELGDSVKMGEMEFYQARVLFEQGLHMESEVKVSKALGVLGNNPLSPIPFEANSMMALCLIERKDYKSAQEYFLKGLSLMQKDYNKNLVLEQDRLLLAMTMLYLNLSDVAYLLKDYDSAIEYATIGLTHVTTNSPPLLTKALEANINASKLLLDVSKGNLSNADIYLKEVEDVYYEALNINNLIFANHQAMMIAELYLAINNSPEALVWAEKSYNLSKEREIIVDQRTALEFILKHSTIKDSKKIDEIIALSHTIEEQDYLTRNRFARIAFETEEIETENNALKNLILIIVIVSLAIILGLSVGVFFYRLNNKDKKLQFVRQQQKADESIYQLILEKNSIKLKTKKAVYSKIAKDIHDGIVNGIFTIRFNLQQLGTDNENLKSRLIKELENLEKTTRDISHALADNEIFKEVNFSGLVEELVGMQKNKWQTKFVFHQDKKVNLEKLSAIKKINIYYIIREAIQNVNKYAHASECFISITHNSDGVFIQIQDNGIGFDPLAVNNGLGLKNMKERATVLKSKLYIDTVKDKGTKVSLELKL
ncbi:tetratricopeptide repeat-containing sensor histidine kinase [Myroides marinus]|uniref:ATP-binding protein n=1 Tax=Myroides marinus TaxID=703342 RepID=UPI002576F820|nr:tetratricopeptide repeat-containing sensor histidine kinase [Myroides marinus]MDM1379510.1 ATP-binding protein [Myroides marinus]MDM1386781.1 ATP-binding protein [Myroides marinus]MDM1393994.1 ATP-binding protein [Myroides marinus]